MLCDESSTHSDWKRRQGPCVCACACRRYRWDNGEEQSSQLISPQTRLSSTSNSVPYLPLHQSAWLSPTSCARVLSSSSFHPSFIRHVSWLRPTPPQLLWVSGRHRILGTGFCTAAIFDEIQSDCAAAANMKSKLPVQFADLQCINNARLSLRSFENLTCWR